MKRSIRILLADDDRLFRRIIREQLSQRGFDVVAVSTGADALRTIGDSEYDVVLLDVQMPGLSGLDTLRQLRRIEDAPEVIMLTGDDSLATGLEAMRLGAYDYLTKPATL